MSIRGETVLNRNQKNIFKEDILKFIRSQEKELKRQELHSFFLKEYKIFISVTHFRDIITELKKEKLIYSVKKGRFTYWGAHVI